MSGHVYFPISNRSEPDRLRDEPRPYGLPVLIPPPERCATCGAELRRGRLVDPCYHPPIGART